MNAFSGAIPTVLAVADGPDGKPLEIAGVDLSLAFAQWPKLHAVEMNLGVALLPRRCAVTELARGTLVATTVPQLRLPRHLRLIYRQAGELSHAAQQFLSVARKHEQAETAATEEPA